jgi:hypothetical protein
MEAAIGANHQNGGSGPSIFDFVFSACQAGVQRERTVCGVKKKAWYGHANLTSMHASPHHWPSLVRRVCLQPALTKPIHSDGGRQYRCVLYPRRLGLAACLRGPASRRWGCFSARREFPLSSVGPVAGFNRPLNYNGLFRRKAHEQRIYR